MIVVTDKCARRYEAWLDRAQVQRHFLPSVVGGDVDSKKICGCTMLNQTGSLCKGGVHLSPTATGIRLDVNYGGFPSSRMFALTVTESGIGPEYLINSADFRFLNFVTLLTNRRKESIAFHADLKTFSNKWQPISQK
jgi:hypothetical protein